MDKKYCYKCGVPIENSCNVCGCSLYTSEPNSKTVKYEEILKIVKNEDLAKDIIQTHNLTNLDYNHILTSMGFKNFTLDKSIF